MVLADAENSIPEHAPYDRIIITPGRIRTCAPASGGRDPVCAREAYGVLPATSNLDSPNVPLVSCSTCHERAFLEAAVARLTRKVAMSCAVSRSTMRARLQVAWHRPLQTLLLPRPPSGS